MSIDISKLHIQVSMPQRCNSRDHHCACLRAIQSWDNNHEICGKGNLVFEWRKKDFSPFTEDEQVYFQSKIWEESIKQYCDTLCQDIDDYLIFNIIKVKEAKLYIYYKRIVYSINQ